MLHSACSGHEKRFQLWGGLKRAEVETRDLAAPNSADVGYSWHPAGRSSQRGGQADGMAVEKFSLIAHQYSLPTKCCKGSLPAIGIYAIEVYEPRYCTSAGD